jgi:hypothetical protein
MRHAQRAPGWARLSSRAAQRQISSIVRGPSPTARDERHGSATGKYSGCTVLHASHGGFGTARCTLALVASILFVLAGGLPGFSATARAAPAEYGVTLTTASPARLDVFTVGADKAVWQKTYSALAGWGDWASIGGAAASQPHAVTWPDGRIDVVVRGAGGHAWMRTFLPSTGQWGSWEDLGGPVHSDVSVATLRSDRIDLFARAADGSLMTRSSIGGSAWTPWSPHTVGSQAGVAPVWWNVGGVDRLDVFGVDSRFEVAQSQSVAPYEAWTDWYSLGESTSETPAASSSGAGRVDVAARGEDGALWLRTWQQSTNVWNEWSTLGGQVVGGPDIQWSADGKALTAAAIDADGDVRITTPTGLGWSTWESLGAPSPVYSTVHWYGAGKSTCLKTGSPTTDSQLCPDVNRGFLADPGANAGGLAHMLEGAVAADIAQTRNGHFCNYYNLGARMTHPDPTDRSGTTGLDTGAPYRQWQQGDLNGNVCQARDNRWGFGVLGGAANNYCNPPYAPCGMHQYISFSDHGAQNRPWGASFASNPTPSLVVSARSDPQVAAVSGGAWGYLCPVLKDATTGTLIEYCFEQWRVGIGYPRIPDFDVVSACASASGYNVDQVITQFAPGTRFATQRPGTGSRYTFAPGTNPPSTRFAASISAKELIRAIDAINAKCGRMLSRNPPDYSVIGVEHGIEGGNLTALGANTSDLQLFSARE